MDSGTYNSLPPPSSKGMDGLPAAPVPIAADTQRELGSAAALAHPGEVPRHPPTGQPAVAPALVPPVQQDEAAAAGAAAIGVAAGEVLHAMPVAAGLALDTAGLGATAHLYGSGVNGHIPIPTADPAGALAAAAAAPQGAAEVQPGGPGIPAAAAAAAAVSAAADGSGAAGQQRSGSVTPAITAGAAESDPLAGTDAPSRGDKDSDFRFSEDEEEEGRSGEEDSDYVFSDEEEEHKRKRWMRPTPEGARRSKRHRGEGDGELGDGGEGGERRDGSTAQPSRAGSEDLSEVVVSPIGQIIKREVSAEQAEAEVRAIQNMWEMASILDFLRRFRPQIKLSREFGADELERVLVTSAGDGGLLADVHIDLMRGISPKSDVSPANWAVHLANKIKYHWKTLSDGTPCPFKPEKYFEAATYAMLPSSQRVKALNFLCSIRADKEDIQERILASENNPKPPAPKPPAPLPPARPARSTRAQSQAPTPEPADETLDSFRREPTGVDASGNAYYFFDMAESIGFRLYREIPYDLMSAKEREEAAADGPADGAGAAAIAAAEEAQSRRRDRRRGRKQASTRKGGSLQLPNPPAAGKWELLASTLEELQAVGERLSRSLKPQDGELGQLISDKAARLVTDLQSRQEAEERRLKAERRVQKKLGVDVAAEFGRARRERRNINYAFTDYDDVIRSAIKRSARDSPEELSGRRRRNNSPPRYDPILEAQRGLRRGRSAAAIHEEVLPGDLNERQLRLMARSRSASGVAELQQAAEEDAAEAAAAAAGHDVAGGGDREAGGAWDAVAEQEEEEEAAQHAQQLDRRDAGVPQQQAAPNQWAHQQVTGGYAYPAKRAHQPYPPGQYADLYGQPYVQQRFAHQQQQEGRQGYQPQQQQQQHTMPGQQEQYLQHAGASAAGPGGYPALAGAHSGFTGLPGETAFHQQPPVQEGYGFQQAYPGPAAGQQQYYHHQQQQQQLYQQPTGAATAWQQAQQQQQRASGGRRSAPKKKKTTYYDDYADLDEEESAEEEQVSDDDYDPRRG
ncbi:hypothetical protein N2152v2_010297 [Parachlorella kessleri]